MESKTMVLAIVGSRGFTDFDLMVRSLDPLKGKVLSVVSGKAVGADTLAREWALSVAKVPIAELEPAWDDLKAQGAVVKLNKYGKKYNARAGFDRNKLIVERCTHLVAFWDGRSRGTSDSVEEAKKAGKPVKVFRY